MEQELKKTVVNEREVWFVETEIDWKGKKEPVRIKKLSFGEMLDLNQSSVKMVYSGKTPSFDLNQSAMSINSLLKSIILAPFPVTAQAIRDLDNDIGQFLVGVFNEVNTPSETKKEP
jgi:hypothetical protein